MHKSMQRAPAVPLFGFFFSSSRHVRPSKPSPKRHLASPSPRAAGPLTKPRFLAGRDFAMSTTLLVALASLCDLSSALPVSQEPGLTTQVRF